VPLLWDLSQSLAQFSFHHIIQMWHFCDGCLKDPQAMPEQGGAGPGLLAGGNRRLALASLLHPCREPRTTAALSIASGL